MVDKFPKKIVHLNKMLSSGKLTCDPSTVYQKINIPVPEVPNRNQLATEPGSSKDPSMAAKAEASNGETGVSKNSTSDDVTC